MHTANFNAAVLFNLPHSTLELLLNRIRICCIAFQQLVLSVGFLAALWSFAAPMGPFMVIEEETVYIDEDEEEEEWFRW